MTQISYPRTKNVLGKVVEEHFVRCPLCNDPMVLRPGRPDFGPGYFYGCSNFPRCKSSHGCHADGRPLGIPADQATKDWRIRAHDALDGLWKTPGLAPEALQLSRKMAYKWMREVMDMTAEEAHIGRFTIEDCQLLIEQVEDRLKGERDRADLRG